MKNSLEEWHIFLREFKKNHPELTHRQASAEAKKKFKLLKKNNKTAENLQQNTQNISQTQEPSTSENNGIPLLITAENRKKLIELGYIKEDISMMTPEKAIEIIEKNISKPIPEPSQNIYPNKIVNIGIIIQDFFDLLMLKNIYTDLEKLCEELKETISIKIISVVDLPEDIKFSYELIKITDCLDYYVKIKQANITFGLLLHNDYEAYRLNKDMNIFMDYISLKIPVICQDYTPYNNIIKKHEIGYILIKKDDLPDLIKKHTESDTESDKIKENISKVLITLDIANYENIVYLQQVYE